MTDDRLIGKCIGGVGLWMILVPRFGPPIPRLSFRPNGPVGQEAVDQGVVEPQ